MHSWYVHRQCILCVIYYFFLQHVLDFLTSLLNLYHIYENYEDEFNNNNNDIIKKRSAKSKITINKDDIIIIYIFLGAHDLYLFSFFEANSRSISVVKLWMSFALITFNSFKKYSIIRSDTVIPSGSTE